jgi:hypothetical protein
MQVAFNGSTVERNDRAAQRRRIAMNLALLKILGGALIPAAPKPQREYLRFARHSDTSGALLYVAPDSGEALNGATRFFALPPDTYWGQIPFNASHRRTARRHN